MWLWNFRPESTGPFHLQLGRSRPGPDPRLYPTFDQARPSTGTTGLAQLAHLRELRSPLNQYGRHTEYHPALETRRAHRAANRDPAESRPAKLLVTTVFDSAMARDRTPLGRVVPAPSATSMLWPPASRRVS